MVKVTVQHLVKGKRNENQVMLAEDGVEKLTYVYRRNAIN